jgi:hypothetical protein
MDLCGMWQRHGAHRYGLLWGYGTPWMHFRMRMAEPFPDVVRAWMASTSSYNRDSLEEPLPFFDLKTVEGSSPNRPDRRQSENDDHGEKYSTADQGPGLSLALTVPRGWSILSFYEFNDDAHVGNGNPRRDYQINISGYPYSVRELNSPPNRLESPRDAETRVVYFAGGGVWKRFLVHGPADVSVRVGRNHSFNTILNAVALDWATEKCPPYFETPGRWWRNRMDRHRRMEEKLAAVEQGYCARTTAVRVPEADVCAGLRWILRLQREVNPTAWAAASPLGYSMLDRYLAALRKSAKSRNLFAEICNYRLCRFRAWESDLGRLDLPVPRKMEQKLQWKGHFRVFRDGGYSQLARFAAGRPTGNGS